MHFIRAFFFFCFPTFPDAKTLLGVYLLTAKRIVSILSATFWKVKVDVNVEINKNFVAEQKELANGTNSTGCGTNDDSLLGKSLPCTLSGFF